MQRLATKSVVLTLVVVCAVAVAWGQNAPPPAGLVQTAESAESGWFNFSTSQRFLFLMANLVLVFGGVVVAAECVYLVWKRQPADVALHFFVTTLVIVGAMYLYVLSGSEQAVSGAFGLFGTLIGYMLGKSTSS